MEANLAAPHTQ